MTTCLCLQHENQFIEYVCLDNKCKQKLHCNKCVKFFGKDHCLVDLKRVEHSLSKLSINDKLITSRNFELADKELVQFIEGNDPGEKQEQFLKSLNQEREEERQNCLKEIQQSIEQVMKDNQRSLFNLQESLQKCYSKKIDEIMSLDQLRNQTFKHKALLMMQNLFKVSEYTELNESVMKLHSGKYELMYAKQQNKQIFFEIQQQIATFIQMHNEMINGFCGQFQAVFQKQVENIHYHSNNRKIQLSKSGMLVKQSAQLNYKTKLPPASQTNTNTSSFLKTETSSYGAQNRFFSSELSKLNKRLLQPIISQLSSDNKLNNKTLGSRSLFPDGNIKLIQQQSQSLVLPAALSPNNMNLTNTYQIKSIGSINANSDYFKEVEAPFKTNNYQTMSSKTLKTGQSVKKNIRNRSSLQFEDDLNMNMYSLPDKIADKSINNRERAPQGRNMGTLNTLDPIKNTQQSSYTMLPTSILNSSINGGAHSSAIALKPPLLNQTFERQIKSVIQINNETFVFGTVDGFMKIMEINNSEKCIYEIEGKQVHQKLSKLNKCWEENGEILFFSHGIDEGGSNSIKLWQMKQGIIDIRQILSLQDLHGKSEIEQVLFLKLNRTQDNRQKIIYFATLSSQSKKQVIKICQAQIDFSYLKRSTQDENSTSDYQKDGAETTSCKVEVLAEIVEELVNKIKKLSFYDSGESRLYAYSSKQIIQYNLDDEMTLSKKLNKIVVQNKVDYIKALIPMTECIKEEDENNINLSQLLNGNSGQKLSNYLLLFTHEGVLKIINSINLSIANNEINLSSLDKNYSYSSQIRKVIAGRDGNCFIAIINHDDQSQQLFELNISLCTLKQQIGSFKDKITKFQLISSDEFITIEDYQDLSIWQAI